MYATIFLLAVLSLPFQEDHSSDTKSAELESPIEAIEKILTAQVQSWNNKDIVGFMATYWKSPKLTFSSGGNTTRGWQATLDRYKAKYPPEKMGTLKFDQLEVSMMSKEVALVLGNWELNLPAKPDDGEASDKNIGKKSAGNFSLVLKKMGDDWKIVHDHSSSLDE